MGTAPRLFRRLLAGAAAAAVLLAGCSGGPPDADGGGSATDPAAAAATGPSEVADVMAARNEGSGARPATGAGSADSHEPGPIDPLDIPGEIINEHSLVEGDCFNRLEGLQAGRRLAVTARTGCDGAHWGEVYHTFELDAPHPAAYPGEDAVRAFALRVCYENFEAFVGEVYELSVYDIGVFVPNRTNFEHDVARYRGVHCWLYDADRESVSGTAEGTAR